MHRGDVLTYDPATHEFVSNPPEGAALLAEIREFAPRKRAIVAFPMTIRGRRTYVQVQLRFSEPSRDRITSFVAFSVDAERLRADYFPQFLTAKLRDVRGRPASRRSWSRWSTTAAASSIRRTARAR